MKRILKENTMNGVFKIQNVTFKRQIIDRVIRAKRKKQQQDFSHKHIRLSFVFQG